MITRKALPAALEQIGEEAKKACVMVGLDDSGRVELYPEWSEAFLRDLSGDVVIRVESTPLGVRYLIYESIAGGALLPVWPDSMGYWIHDHLRSWVHYAYWWSCQHIWGWAATLPWEGLEQALVLAKEQAYRLERTCRFPELLNE